MHLGQTPKGHELTRYYIPSKRNNYADAYLGWNRYTHATIALMLSVSRKNLFIHSNTRRNWYSNKDGEPVVQFYNKVYQDKGELLDFLTTKKDEISSPTQINATIKFLKESLRGKDKEKALKLYQGVMEVVNNRINMINKLAYIKPGQAYKFYKEFKEIFRFDRELSVELDKRFQPIFSNKKILELHRITTQVDDIFSDNFDPQKEERKVQILRQNLVNFTFKNYESSDLCVEAQMVIEKIDRTLQNFL